MFFTSQINEMYNIGNLLKIMSNNKKSIKPHLSAGYDLLNDNET